MFVDHGSTFAVSLYAAHSPTDNFHVTRVRRVHNRRDHCTYHSYCIRKSDYIFFLRFSHIRTMCDRLTAKLIN